DVLAKQTKESTYCFDEMGRARRQFLVESLVDLDNSLQRLGNKLLYLTSTALQPETLPQGSFSPALDTATLLYQLIEQQAVTDICVSQTADYHQNQAYKVLQHKFPHIRWHSQSTATLFAAMPTDGLPKSFTQFRKKVESNNDLLSAENNLEISQLLKMLPPMPDIVVNNLVKNNKCISENQYLLKQSSNNQSQQQQPSEFKGGETSAISHLNSYFESEAPSTYKTTRNALDNWTHSTKFSAWLANGSLSVKVLLNRLRHYEAQVIANESTYWIWFELLWREYFYWYALTHQQKLFWFRGISQDAPSTCTNKQSPERTLEQWQTGTTSYPIVNACMHQLKSTGYISNRGRQIVASCFIHELGLDWRYGASHFEQHLIDYDVASNWGNWQYLAGVGADPRGCRQFNLKKQTQQYDPNGDFINKWQGIDFLPSLKRGDSYY
ncbi:MAG TPA: DASH family cryptochrome, partial [Psychrobacter sp.]|uniref:DASH family cryptochrome n=1 Tax=Psychrobacter sp. TaxID=56811 RepID=UPI002C35C237